MTKIPDRCIRKWRQSKEFELDVAKACPECRIASDFVYPSKYWVENKQEKDEFIDAQKQRMQKQDCRSETHASDHPGLMKFGRIPKGKKEKPACLKEM
ncbi:hypothetical protein NQ315_017284 [Exocentrus adspersus]|uniref:Uncharacterized protein n=1 Tax=Exocentrus adspersus TaxID=1586481 RepID=A0AAV8VK88_9CUCU|nr:hypothetical protein NQ315_017284 [Exocentrus adspersus]